MPYQVGVRLPEGIVEELPRHREPMVAQTYNYTVYYGDERAMDRIALSLSRMLQEAGYRALPVPATQTVDKAKLAGSFRRSWRPTWPGWAGSASPACW